MADEIEDDGPGRSSYFSTAATTLQKSSHASSSRSTGQQQPSRPHNQPGFDRQHGPSESTKTTGVVQPKPQALPRRTGPASIIVSPRQKGNPVLEKIKSMPWEYGDIPADYVLGATTCALFLSLKYHRLHPEYIYGRIKALQGKYALRIVLTMVDIESHEQSLKELSKTSIINNVTIVLCWSAAEGARYLELFKTYENAAPTSIKQHQSNAYSDRMADFITTPRSINKTDAVSLVTQFGTIRTAINAPHDEVATIAGWGEKKVQQWCNSVREPFRVKRAAKRGLALENMLATQPVSLSQSLSRGEGESPAPSRPGTGGEDADRRPSTRLAEEITIADDDAYADDEDPLADAMVSRPLPAKTTAPQAQDAVSLTSRSPPPPKKTTAAPAQDVVPAEPKKRKKDDDPVNDGVMAALNKLRKPG